MGRGRGWEDKYLLRSSLGFAGEEEIITQTEQVTGVQVVREGESPEGSFRGMGGSGGLNQEHLVPTRACSSPVPSQCPWYEGEAGTPVFVCHDALISGFHVHWRDLISGAA